MSPIIDRAFQFLIMIRRCNVLSCGESPAPHGPDFPLAQGGRPLQPSGPSRHSHRRRTIPDSRVPRKRPYPRGRPPSARTLLRLVFLCAAATLMAAPTAAGAQESEESTATSTQVWGTFQVFKPLWDKQLVMHFEGRTGGFEGDAWGSLDGRARVNFYLLPWLDVFPELLLRYTHQTAELNSTTATVRGGVRFGVPNTAQVFNRERVPLQRFDFSVLIRLEWRNFFYSNGDYTSDWRTRVRLEGRFPINHVSLGADNNVYLRGDEEVFFPIGEEAGETFAKPHAGGGNQGTRGSDRQVRPHSPTSQTG